MSKSSENKGTKSNATEGKPPIPPANLKSAPPEKAEVAGTSEAVKFEPTPTISPVQHPDIQIAAEEAKRTFGEFRTAWRNCLGRAVENGRAIARLQTLCVTRGVGFVETLEHYDIPVSTAYDNRDLASCWDRAQEIIKAGGVDQDKCPVEFKSARALHEFVNPTKPKPTATKKPRSRTSPAAPPRPPRPPSATATAAGADDPGVPPGFVPPDTHHSWSPADDSPEVVASVAALTQRYLSRMGDRVHVVTVVPGATVQISGRSFQVNGPVLLLPESGQTDAP